MCKRWIRPLTLWQELILEGIGSPFVDDEGDREVFPEDVLTFLRVAECQYPETPRFRRGWRGLRDWWHWRRMSRDREVLIREATRVHGWIHETKCAPEFWRPEEPGNPITGPATWALVWKLVTSCSYSLKAAMNETRATAWWASAQVDELRGDGRRFAWARDLEPPEDFRDVRDMSEDEILAQARKELGPGRYEAWVRARRQAATKRN